MDDIIIEHMPISSVFVEVQVYNSEKIFKEHSLIQPTLENVKAINLKPNFRQHSAQFAFINQARFDSIVNFDDSHQHPPEEIPKLLYRSSDGFDAVYGKLIKHNHLSLRSWGSKILTSVFW